MEERREGGRERQGGQEREVVSIHKQTAVTRMDKMSLCVCVQNILTGQRLGNESLPLKCCHGVSLQKRGGHIKGRSQVKGIRTCNFFVFDC